MSQFSACTLKLGCNFPHPFLFHICQLQVMQRKCQDPSRQRSCKEGASNPELSFWLSNNAPGVYIWEQHISSSPVKPSRVGDICYCGEALLINALFPKAFMAICLSPAHLPCLHSSMSIQNRSAHFPIRPPSPGREWHCPYSLSFCFCLPSETLNTCFHYMDNETRVDDRVQLSQHKQSYFKKLI